MPPPFSPARDPGAPGSALHLREPGPVRIQLCFSPSPALSQCLPLILTSASDGALESVLQRLCVELNLGCGVIKQELDRRTKSNPIPSLREKFGAQEAGAEEDKHLCVKAAVKWGHPRGVGRCSHPPGVSLPWLRGVCSPHQVLSSLECETTPLLKGLQWNRPEVKNFKDSPDDRCIKGYGDCPFN